MVTAVVHTLGKRDLFVHTSSDKLMWRRSTKNKIAIRTAVQKSPIFHFSNRDGVELQVDQPNPSWPIPHCQQRSQRKVNSKQYLW